MLFRAHPSTHHLAITMLPRYLRDENLDQVNRVRIFRQSINKTSAMLKFALYLIDSVDGVKRYCGSLVIAFSNSFCHSIAHFCTDAFINVTTNSSSTSIRLSSGASIFELIAQSTPPFFLNQLLPDAKMSRPAHRWLIARLSTAHHSASLESSCAHTSLIFSNTSCSRLLL